MPAAGGASSAFTALPFAPLETAPDVGFWQELTRRKLDCLRLDDSPIPVCAAYDCLGERPKCLLLQDSFEQTPAFEGKVLVRGDLKNFNTQEDFRAFLGGSARAEKTAQVASALRDSIESGDALREPHRLRPMIMVAFADLKKYLFAYTVSYPVLASATKPWLPYRETSGPEEVGVGREALKCIAAQLVQDAVLAAAGAFLLTRAGREMPWEVRPLGELPEHFSLSSNDLCVGFIDPSAGNCGWPARNLITAVARHRPGRLQLLSFRDSHLSANGDGPIHSRVFYIQADSAIAKALVNSDFQSATNLQCADSEFQPPPRPPPPAEAQIAGWSKIQTMDLTVFLDKKKIAADAVDLNVKLMKWRMLPELEPEKMRSLSVLLLGSGTLGCGVARTLMAWGVRKMTFLDNGKVALSNPVRQSLFTHADAAEGRPKALAAAEAVRAVMPDAEVTHVEMEIPMPGHPHQTQEALERNVQRMTELVDSHDVVCMLTDSRESRWLPALLVSVRQQRARANPEEARERPPPLGLTVALGFDSFLVSRQTYTDSRAACYFCNDVTAPADSIANRTLDQQCTVTRPGLSGLASNVAVELLAALVQHPSGFHACGSSKSEGSAAVPTGVVTAVGESPLGQVPHQVRGYLSDFRLAPAETEPFEKCICCSGPVLTKYVKEGWQFVSRITKDSSELEKLSGLADMKAALNEDQVISFDDEEGWD